MLEHEQSTVMRRSAKTADTDDFPFEVHRRVDFRLNHEALRPPRGHAHDSLDGRAVENRRDSRCQGEVEIDIAANHRPRRDCAIHHYDQDLKPLLFV